MRIHTDALNPSEPSTAVKSAKPRTLSYNLSNFTLDGRPIRIVSGSVHYFRIPPARWRAVLQLARHMGLNAIETYVPWNLHEPVQGTFRFSGILNLPHFLSLAHELGLLVLLRPGPYICSEWDFGGLPAYLLRDPEMRVRTLHPGYMKAVKRYIATLSTVIEPYVGRPVVALQIENEYGRYAIDRAYLHALVEAWDNAGFTRDRLVHFTSDNGEAEQVMDGSPFDSGSVLKTMNFGSDVDANMRVLHSVQPDAPSMVTEFWVGWYDHWGSKHNTRSGDAIASMLRDIVFKHEANVNFYMFIGGTNFGFMAGANLMDDDLYRSDTTSYDYDAFVTEFADMRASKFDEARSVLREFWTMMNDKQMLTAMDETPPHPPYLSPYAGKVELTARVPLLNVLDHISNERHHTQFPQPAESIGGDYGYVLYRHSLSSPLGDSSVLQLQGVHDIAFVLLDDVLVDSVDRNKQNDTTDVSVLKRIHIGLGTKRIDIIVENSGRVNYGLGIHDRKGLIGNVILDGTTLEGFDTFALSFPQDHEWLRDVSLRRSIDLAIGAMGIRAVTLDDSDSMKQPFLFHGVLTLNPGANEAFDNELPSCYCRIFGRGTLWINGFNVGRFNTGVPAPQRSLFVPGSLLREGKNDIVVLHVDPRLVRGPAIVEFFDHPDFGTV